MSTTSGNTDIGKQPLPVEVDTDGRTMTEEDFDLAVGHVTSFYQSKRAMLKKQVTHWIGKFMIVKAENNRIRHLLVVKTIYAKMMEDRVRYLEGVTKERVNARVDRFYKEKAVQEVTENIIPDEVRDNINRNGSVVLVAMGKAPC
jgi:hypothetical protein